MNQNSVRQSNRFEAIDQHSKVSLKEFVMVPNGWEVKSLDDIANITSGGTPSKTNLKYWEEGDVPWLRTSEVKNCTIYSTDVKIYITQAGLKNSSAKLFPKGTILLAMIGQGKTRGQVALLNFEASTNQNCSAIIFDQGYHPAYYFNYLLSQYEKIRNLSNSAGQSNLSGGLIKTIKVPIPPLPEQQKIAKIISTWDKAISITSSLIETSKQQKKALMQQILTAKKCLLSETGTLFKGSWTEKSLSQICTIQKGKQLNKSTLEKTGMIPVINGGITPSGFAKEANTSANTITISEGGNSCGYVGFQKISFWCGGHCYSLKKINLDTNYLYHFLKFYQPIIMRLRVGSGLPNIQKKAIEHFMISFPSSAEQQKIASVLTIADKEIEVLEAKLTHFKQEKKALMQQLLTGKRRVKVDQTEKV